MLITYIVLLVVGLVAGISMVARADRFSTGLEFLMGLSGFIALTLSVVFATIGLGLSYQWYAAEQKASLINREYGTQYTQAEVFFASDVIDTIRHIDRKRIELNGDLLR